MLELSLPRPTFWSRSPISEYQALRGVAHPVKLHIGASTEPALYNGCPFLVMLGKSYKIPFISHTTMVSF
jgi:hypothetical protein